MFGLRSNFVTQDVDQSAEAEEPREFMSGLVSAYQERGYEAGYARGVNDALASVLEVTEEFARLQPESVAQTRHLLFAFSEFLEKRVRQTPRDQTRDFIDGLGI